MLENDDDLEALQRVLEDSAAGSGEHLRSAFGRDRWLSASALAEALVGIVEVHLAALSATGAPLVAPVDAILFKGRLWIGFPAASLRAKLLRRDPRVSVSYVRGDLGLIVHGTFNEVSDEEAVATGYAALARELYVAAYGAWFGEWLDRKQGGSNDLTGFVEPRVMFAKQ